MTRFRMPVTVHVFFRRDDQILLLRRFQTGYMDGYYSAPAGHLDGDEPVRLAAIREAHEEVGLSITPSDLNFAGVFHRREDRESVDFFFTIYRWDGEPCNAEPEKCDEVRWVNIAQLPQNTVPYVRRAIENSIGHIPFEEFGWGKDPA